MGKVVRCCGKLAPKDVPEALLEQWNLARLRFLEHFVKEGMPVEVLSARPQRGHALSRFDLGEAVPKHASFDEVKPFSNRRVVERTLGRGVILQVRVVRHAKELQAGTLLCLSRH